MSRVEEHYVEMSDGVRIYTLVQLPEEQGRYPVKFWRNPYVSQVVDVAAKAREDTRGYVHVTQHCRGCGKSGGDCIPYIHERQDGLDSLAWIRQQPFYNGEIYPIGGSYLSSVHFAYLDTEPADIKAAVLPIQDCVRYNILYRNGFYKSGLHGGWFVGMYKKNSLTAKRFVPDMFRTMPLAGISQEIFGERSEQFEAELAHPDPEDAFWRTHEGGADSHDALRHTHIPLLLVTAFHDIYTEGVFDIWDSLPAETRQKSALLVSPYQHNTNYDANSCPVQFPNGGLNEACPDFAHEWIEHVRTGAPLSFICEGETTYYRLWENAWHHAPRLEDGGREVKLFLRGDRTLGREPATGGEITYVYNPYAPASFKGGCCNTFGGMQIQDKPNSRYDIISYMSAPLEEAMTVEGVQEVELRVRSDRPDTCFYVRLSLVKGETAYGLRDDITSVCRQHGGYRAGDEVVLRFHLAQHSFMAEAGDRLRLDVSSSCVPHYTVHTNRRGLQYLQCGADVAHNTIAGGSLTLHCLS